MTLVCSACGSPSCALGEWMCDAAIHADVAPCSCDWSHNSTGPSGATPTIVNPGCLIHGEEPS